MKRGKILLETRLYILPVRTIPVIDLVKFIPAGVTAFENPRGTRKIFGEKKNPPS